MAFLALIHIWRTGYSQRWRHRGGSEVDEDQGGVLAQRVNRSEADGIGSRMGSGCLKEMAYLRRCTGRGFGRQAQMSEDFDNHCGIFNGRDER